MMLKFCLPILLLSAACGRAGSGGGDAQSPNSGNTSDPGPRSSAQLAACQSPSVRSISVPMQPDQPGSPNFEYSYEYAPPTRDGAPTIVYVPGGPGQTAIGEGNDWQQRLPDGAGYLLTDPRGVGCNANHNQDNQLPDAAYTSRYVAGDINAAIKHEGLSNYLLYGISYGTVVATIMASQAETGLAPAPQAVLLEGTVGKAFADGQSDANYARLWQMKMDNNPAFKAAFADDHALPLGFSTEVWLTVIRSTLMYGTAGSKSGPVDYLDTILHFATSSSPELQDKARKFILDMTGHSGDKDPTLDARGFARFYLLIACREIWPSLDAVTLQAGQMVSGSGNLCQQDNLNLTLTDGFDAAKWPIKAPIYYFEGSNDPAVPVPLAQYHFASQTTSPGRQLLLVGKAGHNPLEISLGDCARDVIGKLGQRQSLDAAASGCNWAPGLSLESAAGTRVLQAPSDATPETARITLTTQRLKSLQDLNAKLGSSTGS